MGIISKVVHRLRADAVNYVASGLGIGLLDATTAPTIWDWLTKSGLAHRIVWAVPEDALSDGWRTDTDDAQDVTRDEDAALLLEDRLVEVMGSARIGGGAWLWPVTSDAGKLAEPVADGPHEIHNVVVIAREEATPNTWDADPASLMFGRPKTLQVNISRGGISYNAEIHVSRLIYVPGSRAAVNQQGGELRVYGMGSSNDGYDVSTLALYLPAITDLERAWSSTASLVTRLSVWWLRLTAGHVQATAEDTAAEELAQRLQLIQSSVSTRSLVPLLNDDEMGWSGPSASGVRDLVNALAERCSAVEGIPLSRLFGTPPGGLTSDDAAGRRAYNALLARQRRDKLTPALLRLYELIYGVDPGRRIVWPDLDKPTAAEAATISLTLAQRDAVLVQQVGSLLPEESRARFADGEEVPIPVLDDAAWNVELAEPELPVSSTMQAPADPLAEGAPTLQEAERIADPGEPATTPAATPKVTPTTEGAAVAGALGGGTSVADLALNGAQVQSLMDLLQGVTDGTTAPGVAALVISSAFPTIPQDRAAEMVSLAAAFTPAEPEAPPPTFP